MPHFIGEMQDFDQLKPTQVALSIGVPIIDGSVSVNCQSEEKGRLAVNVSLGSIDVAREDGSLLQVVIYSEEFVEGEGYVSKSGAVLDDPLKRMTFTRQPDGWSLQEVDTLTDEQDKYLKCFAFVLGMFATKKQRQQDGSGGGDL